MPYSIEYDQQADIILVTVDGPLTVGTIHEYANTVALISKEQGCFRVLTDLRGASIQLSMLEIYNLPKMLAEIVSSLGLLVQKFRRADVLPDQWSLSLFYETVSKNRVQNVALFQDIETAGKWLLEK